MTYAVPSDRSLKIGAGIEVLLDTLLHFLSCFAAAFVATMVSNDEQTN